MGKGGFKFDSGSGFKASPAKVSFGQKSDPQQNMLMGYILGQQKPKEAVGIAQDVNNQFPGGSPPPGTDFNYGGISGPINPKRTVEEAQSLSGADTITNHINYIKNMQSDPAMFRSRFEKATFRGTGAEKGKLFGFPLTYGDKESGNLKFALDDMANRLVYLFSGKQINEEEFKRLSNTLPSYSDISDPNDIAFSQLNNKLDSFESSLSGIKNRLIQGGSYDANFWEGENGMNKPMNIQGPNSSPIPGSPGYQPVQPSSNPQLQVPQGPGGSQPTFINPQQQQEDPKTAFLKRKGLI